MSDPHLPSVKERVKETMQQRNVKVPQLAKETGIPQSRIYKWFSEGNEPKTTDATTLENWIKGKEEVEKIPMEKIGTELELYKKYTALLEEKVGEGGTGKVPALMENFSVSLNDLSGLLETQVRYQQVLVELKLLELEKLPIDGKDVDAVLRKYGVKDSLNRKDNAHTAH